MTTPLTTWRVDFPSKSRVVTDDDDRIIVAEGLSHEHARLIASAPALFAALLAYVELEESAAPYSHQQNTRFDKRASSLQLSEWPTAWTK